MPDTRGARPRDQAVRDRIAREFDRNFLVEAGAGSGKTHSLATRMAAGIEAGAYQVEHIAAVTFTRKAASELRGRFQLALEARLGANPPDDARVRLETALTKIERLFAGTIHAFCAHLLRERPVDARIAPGFVELDDVQDARFRKRAWRNYVTAARAQGVAPLLALLDAGVKPKDLDSAFAVVCEHEDVTFEADPIDPADPAPVWAAFDTLWAELRARRPETFDAGTTCPLQQRWDEYDGRQRRARRDRPADLAALLQAWRPKVTQKFWGADGKRVSQLVAAFTESQADPWMRLWRAYVYRLAVAVLVAAREAYARERRHLNVVNYVDLLRVTAKLLHEQPAVRRALQAKYRWLFIDEFQDTDPIQADIFLQLAADEETGGLRPGALFVVGDPKQSIYRFRRADIDIYMQVARRIVGTGGETVSLTANFRSIPSVCAVANTVFPAAFAAHGAPYSPPFTPLDPVRDEPGAAPGLAVLDVPCKAAKGPERMEAVRAEARLIAAYIQAEVAAGRRHFGDFLVITRQRTRLRHYADACDALDIPTEVSGAGLFCESPEVGALALVLRALADPLDAVTLVGVLRGPFFGLSDADLFQHVSAGGRLDIQAPLTAQPPAEAGARAGSAGPRQGSAPAKADTRGNSRPQRSLPLFDAADDRDDADADAGGPDGPVAQALRTLQAWRRLTRRLPLAAAVDQILEDSGWLALAATTPGGARAGHLLQAIDEVRQVAEAGGGLIDAAVALEEADGDESTESEAWPLEPGRADVVRIMNLHKAKGLEAPVVILADPLNTFDFSAEVRIERTDGAPRGHFCVVRSSDESFVKVVLGQPLNWDALAEEEDRYLAAERARALYVAGTRARDLLVISRATAPGKNTAWAVFDPVLHNACAIEPPAPAVPVSLLDEAVSPAGRAAAAEARAARQAAQRAPSWTITSASDEKARLHAAPRVRALATDPAAGEIPDDAPHRVDAGAAWGSLLHGLLEHAMRHAGATRDDLARLARWLTVEHDDLRPFIGEALDWVEAVRTLPFWAEASASGASVEAPFAVRVDDGTACVLRRGIVDLVFRAADGWHIIDYKTDLVNDGAEAEAVLRAAHGAQLASYADAWRRATGEPVARTAIVSLRTGRVVDV